MGQPRASFQAHCAGVAPISGRHREAIVRMLPYEWLPSFVWPIVGILLVVCVAASAYRFVVHQVIVAGRELAGAKGDKPMSGHLRERR
jgi:hypothetical protein